MRKNRWLRYGLASMTLMGAGLGTLLVACGDDDDNVTAPKVDGGGSDSPNNGDTGPGADARTDGPVTPVDAGTNAKLQLVNAATDFGPSNPVGALRVCYGLGPTAAVAPLPPLPDRKSNPAQPYPGVYIGTGGAVQGTGADLTTVAITPFVMNAGSLAARGILKPDAGGAGTSCTDLFAADAGGALVDGVDYWKLPVIPANTFVKEKSFILVLTGCAGDATSTADKCGPGFVTGAPGLGNLKVTVHEVDNATTIAADKIGTQFIHASAAGAAFLAAQPGGALAVIPGYITDGNDPSTFKGITGDGGVGGATAVALNTKSPLAQVSGVTVASDSFTANPNVGPIAIPLPSVQLLTYGGNVPDGGEYRNGASFTFIALGDPAALPAEPTNTKRFHYIALPNNPLNEVYKP